MDFQKAPYTYVDRVDLYVKNVQRSKDFYTKMLGLSLLTEEANLITFTANGLSPLITIEQKDGALPLEKRSAGLYHFALLVPTRKDLAAIAAHLMKEGYPLVGGADHAVSEALYLEDPDGNGIEIYRDRSSDSWQWENGRVFMPTEALDEHLLDEWDRAPWKRIAVGTKMGHLHLQVADIKETEKFYLDGLGFDLVAQYGPWADFIS
ncbi:VOC family protein, partial [Sporolactobacillus sp. CPB3-1]